MNSIIVTGGSIPEKHVLNKYLDKNSVIIAADSGLEKVLEYGLTPAWLIGDMDSVNPELIPEDLPPERIIRHSVDKDETDTELAVRFARSLSSRVILAGGGEGRLDHTLAIYHIFFQKMYPDLWLTEKEEIHVIRGKNRFSSMRGKNISFFAPDSRNCSVETEGLKWPIDNLDWDNGAYSLSNRTEGDHLVLNVLAGFLIMTVSYTGNI